MQIKLYKLILKDRMGLHKLLTKLSQMGSIFTEVFDVKALNEIYLIYQSNTVLYREDLKNTGLIMYMILKSKMYMT